MSSRERARWWRARIAEVKPLVLDADPWGFVGMGAPEDEYDDLLSAVLSQLVSGHGAEGVIQAVRHADPHGPDAEPPDQATPSLVALAERIERWYESAPPPPQPDKL